MAQHKVIAEPTVEEILATEAAVYEYISAQLAQFGYNQAAIKGYATVN